MSRHKTNLNSMTSPQKALHPPIVSTRLHILCHQHSLLRSSPDTGLINPIPHIPLTRTTKISEPTIFIYHLNTPNTFLHRAPLQHHLPQTISGIASASSALSHRFYPTVPELPYSCTRPLLEPTTEPEPASTLQHTNSTTCNRSLQSMF